MARTPSSRAAPDRPATPDWTLLSNHGHVLICVARDPDMRLADIATRVGIRERAVHRIITDLVEAGYLTRTRVGRRNRYAVVAHRPMRHPLERDHAVGELLHALT